MKARRAHRWVVLGAAALGVLGCSTARRRADVQLVRRIDFRGAHGGLAGDRTDYALRSQMAQRPSPPFLLTWPLSLAVVGSLYRPRLLEHDAERVETYLAHHGWFDAEVRFEVKQRRRDRPKKAGVIDLIGRVDLGPATRWADGPRFIVEGELPATVPLDALRAQSLIREGRRFRLEDVDDTEAAVLRLLRDRGLAHATAELDLLVRADDQRAIATWRIRPGQEAVVGPITVSGAELRHDTTAIDLAGLHEGEAWSETRQSLARDRLYGTGAFSQVNIVEAGTVGQAPETDPEGREILPVDLALSPGKPRQTSLGASIGLEGRYLEPQVAASWTHANLGDRLTRLDLGLSTGFGYTPDRSVPLAEVWIRRTQPRLWTRRLSWQLALEAESGIYQLVLPRTDGRLRSTWTLTPVPGVSLGLEPQLRWTRLAVPRLDGDDEALAAALGPGFETISDRAFGNQYLMAELAADLDLQRLRPVGRRQNGARLNLRGALLDRLFRSSPAFGRLDLDARAYWAPRAPVLGKPAQLMLRLQGHQLLRTTEQLPYPERLFLGGASSFRGFRAGQVGPYDCVCVPRPRPQGAWGLLNDPEKSREGDIQRHYLPRGGQTAVSLAGELQLHRVFLDEVTISAFGEVGGLVDEPADLASDLRVAGGVGFRYDTAIGPLRVDVAVRPIYAEDAGPERFIGCDGYAFRRRAFDLLSEAGRFQRTLERRLPAINLYISLGEAL